MSEVVISVIFIQTDASVFRVLIETAAFSLSVIITWVSVAALRGFKLENYLEPSAEGRRNCLIVRLFSIVQLETNFGWRAQCGKLRPSQHLQRLPLGPHKFHWVRGINLLIEGALNPTEDLLDPISCAEVEICLVINFRKNCKTWHVGQQLFHSRTWTPDGNVLEFCRLINSAIFLQLNSK